MKKYEELQQKISTELTHIPSGIEGSPQNQLRTTYYIERMSSLRSNPKCKTKEEALQIAIRCVAKHYPDFKPEYDKEFFKLEKKKEPF